MADMTPAEARQAIRRAFLIYDGEQAWLNHDRQAAQQEADAGKLVYEYGLISRLRGANDVMVPVNKED